LSHAASNMNLRSSSRCGALVALFIEANSLKRSPFSTVECWNCPREARPARS
jgi:hypothetical protein